MGFALSPSVNVKEIDLTTSIPAVATSIGATCGQFAWGAVEEVMLADTEANLVKKVGLPNDKNYKDWYSAANFLSYGKNLKVVRTVGTGALNASDSVVGGNTPLLIKNLADFEAQDLAITTQGDSVFAKYPGAEGNDIVVEVADSASFANTVISHGAVTGAFTLGDAVTGGTSAATGTIVRVNASSIELDAVTGTFVSGDALTARRSWWHIKRYSSFKLGRKWCF